MVTHHKPVANAFRDLTIENVAIAQLKPYSSNARTHSKKQLKQIASSIREFGFTNPVLIDRQLQIVAGHGRVEAAKLLGMTYVPALRIEFMSDEHKRAYVIADNRIAENAGWSKEILAIELKSLVDIDTSFDVEITGFETAEIDLILDSINSSSAISDACDEVPDVQSDRIVSRRDDLWMLDSHLLLCADATKRESYNSLMRDELAQMIFIDPPYNVPIDGHVSGLGSIKHREFAMASGEMSSSEFVSFLATVFGNLTSVSVDGSIHFVCMDWRHMHEVLLASSDVYTELKNLCVWGKTNAGMGTFYRSQHELVFAFKQGIAPHINTFELGQYGRHRSNLWMYSGVNTLKADRMKELAMHPTVKPVALVADAIRDVTRRNDIVLDAFSGSGTTIIAAEKTGRRARMIEIDPLYVDTAIMRWQTITNKSAILHGTDKTFADIEEQRSDSQHSETQSNLNSNKEHDHV